MTGPIRCQDCRHFQPDESNPTAGMGRCMHTSRHGYWFPGEIHRCEDHNPKPTEEKPTCSP